MRARAGFTLIELLIVVVIIGLLAAIAIPKFASTKENAYVAEMRADLRNLASAQEAYFSEGNGYFAGALPSTALVYNASPGIIVVINEGTVAGWSASTSHASTARTCSIFVGTAAIVAPASQEGVVACDPA